MLQVLLLCALHQGECIATKVLSQELWILVHVLCNHPSSSMTSSGGSSRGRAHLTPLEFLHVTL